MNSEKLFERAMRVIPGGVNSPVRSFGAVGGIPVYMERGTGATLLTEDGTQLTDYCCSWGALILGHAHPAVYEAVHSASAGGTSFGANTKREVEMAELLCGLAPYIDKVRLVNSGTEATMTALRLARGVTGRNKILKFDGCYHGHVDALLVSAGSGLLTSGVSSSAGIPESVVADTLVAPYNDLDAVQEVIGTHGDDLAAIIVEPIAANMGLVSSTPGFLEGLREVAMRCGAILIFDEVITGFRLGPTTYGALRGVTPDLTCLGKIIGGGMPIGAVGGRSDIMEILAPAGPVYQAGTLSGNPVAVAAGLATLGILKSENPYPRLEQLGSMVADGLNDAAREAGVEMQCAQTGSMFTPFFTMDAVLNLGDAKHSNTQTHATFFHGLLDRGVYLPPSQFEVGFICAAHTEDDVNCFIKAARETLLNCGTQRPSS